MFKPLSFYACIFFGFQLFNGFAAQAAPSTLCDTAAKYAAERTGVPLSILRAVSLAETGQTDARSNKFSAWPWAIQSRNRGHWFLDKETAISYVNDLISQGVRNIDIGCFQLNLHWHGAAFHSLDDMILPQKNAIYAAQFLQDLYTKTGDWRTAVGRYHSQDDVRARAYVTRLKRVYNTHIAALPPPGDPPQAAENKVVAPKNRGFGLVAARGPLVETRGSTRSLILGSP